jgi:hypothetical protein
MRITTVLLLLIIGSAVQGNAQVVAPAGFTRHTTQLRVVGTVHSSSPVWVLRADTTETHSLWPWALVGAVGGAAIGAALGAWSIAHSDDVFFPELAIGYGIGIGALGGAAVGAIFGSIYNGAHRDSRH